MVTNCHLNFIFNRFPVIVRVRRSDMNYTVNILLISKKILEDWPGYRANGLLAGVLQTTLGSLLSIRS